MFTCPTCTPSHITRDNKQLVIMYTRLYLFHSVRLSNLYTKSHHQWQQTAGDNVHSSIFVSQCSPVQPVHQVTSPMSLHDYTDTINISTTHRSVQQVQWWDTAEAQRSLKGSSVSGVKHIHQILGTVYQSSLTWLFGCFAYLTKIYKYTVCIFTDKKVFVL